VLIEKEWLGFGHMFHRRIGYGGKAFRKKERSQKAPIFVQFIDSVWQLMRQYPFTFEFNDQLLMFILYHLFSCLYGTFLCNSERDRIIDGIPTKTASLWAAIDLKIDKFRNPQFQKSSKNRTNSASAVNVCDVIIPKTDKSELKLWNQYLLSDNSFSWGNDP